MRIPQYVVLVTLSRADIENAHFVCIDDWHSVQRPEEGRQFGGFGHDAAERRDDTQQSENQAALRDCDL